MDAPVEVPAMRGEADRMKVDVLRAFILSWIIGQQGERVGPPQPLLRSWRVAVLADINLLVGILWLVGYFCMFMLLNSRINTFRYYQFIIHSLIELNSVICSFIC